MAKTTEDQKEADRKRNAFLAIKRREGEQKQGPQTVAADPPAQPTREHRRRILDALDAHYLVEQQCYAKSFSDEALAKTLALPRAWITEERERAFGPDVNEARTEMVTKAEDLERRAAALEERWLTAASEAEAIKREAAKLRVAVSYAA